MARVTSDSVEIVSINLQIAKAELLETGDPETILWALDQLRQADACLRAVIAEHDIAPDEASSDPESAWL